MPDIILEFLRTKDFMPHGQCFQWLPELLWLHVMADALIVVSYYSIPFALFYFVRNRHDLEYRWVYLLFGLFIFLCGSTHLVSILTVWFPHYWLSGTLKAVTALVSLVTAILLWSLLPKLLALPSPKELLIANRELEKAVTRHEETENQLQKLSLAVEYSSGMIVITDSKGRIEYCNPTFYRVTGYSAENVLGKKTSVLKSGLTDPLVYKDLWRTLLNGDSWHGEFLDRKKNDELYWCLQSISPIKNKQGAITNFVSIAHDISERKLAEETIRHLAFYDPLTHLPNRMLFRERLEQALLHAKRSSALFSLMYLDLDRFKNINDTLGHLIGDKLLIEVGARIKQCLREQETIARLGGDEFAIIILDIPRPTIAGKVAQKMLDAFTAPFTIDGHELFVSTSIGISVYPNDATHIDQLIKQADEALYLAKAAGRNSYEYYNESTNALTVKRLALETQLRHALQRGEFALFYQPKIDLQSKKVVGLEALLRWTSAYFGNISPDEFIPIAEDTGLIIAIGDWVLKTACKTAVAWQQQYQIHLPIAINLSPRQFQQQNLLESIDAVINETGIDPDYLEFEITESMIMDKPDKAVEILHGFKKRGLKLAIDDFGTGYSSLNYLKRFPVNALKIDKSFVRDIATDQDDASIVKAVIALAHSLNLEVIAEGVENNRQLEFLREQQCNKVQGYLFSPPVSSEALPEKLLDLTDNEVIL